MSQILDIIDKISDIDEGIRKTEKLLSEFPDSLAVAQNLRSLVKRRESLELRFHEATAQSHLDVFRYRLLSDSGYSVLSVGNTLSSFQRWFGVVYDSLKNGPKKRARLSPEAFLESELSFGYSFSGSLGLALTIPSDRTLFENDLELAIQKLFEMARSDSSDQIAYFSKELGPAPVRALKEWVQNQVDGGFGVAAQWLRGEEVKYEYESNLAHLKDLALAISETSDEIEEEVVLIGELVGADTENRKFHFKTSESEDIRGMMSESISLSMVLELPQRYEATIKSTTFINYATEEETTRYHLSNLKKV